LQSAETVLGVLRERGRRGLPCNELYRQMFNPELYLLAYGRIYSNAGAMTPGASAETVDGMQGVAQSRFAWSAGASGTSRQVQRRWTERRARKII
jgi:hypothetical protein